MAAAIIVDKQEVQIALGQFKAGVADRGPILRICGELMRTSIARTFRDEGSPAGSWPALALSTLKRKGYSLGHKLLVLTGRLRNSFTYEYTADTLTIGTSVVYAAVHQFGSKDHMGGAAGPRAESQMVSVARTAAFHAGQFLRYAKTISQGKDGKWRTVRKRAQGPADSGGYHEVAAHARRQNIPARPFLVFRPEDPQRMVFGIESYLRGKAVNIGKLGGALATGGAQA